MPLRVWGYTNSEYLYILIDGNLTLKYRTQTIRSQDGRRTYVKGSIWQLGSRKKQKGGFLPILGTIVRSFLVSGPCAIGSKRLDDVEKKYIVVEKIRRLGIKRRTPKIYLETISF